MLPVTDVFPNQTYLNLLPVVKVKGAGKLRSPVAHFQGDSAVSLMYVPVPAKLEVDADTDSSARS